MSKSRRSSFFSPLSARAGGSPSAGSLTTNNNKNELEVSRITRKLHIKIQTTTHGCFSTLFLLLGVPDTTADQTPFPLLADQNVDLLEWHIHALDANWAAPALSESAARAAAIFKIPVSTDMALDESEPTNTAVVVSMADNLHLIVPAGTAGAGDGSGPKGAHAENGKRGYLVTLLMEINHLREATGWPLQVTIPVPRCLMNSLEFRISTSDSTSAKDSPIRIFPKLIGGSSDDASDPSSSTSSTSPTNDTDALAIRRCSIVTGPKLKGIFTATSHLTFAWLRAAQTGAGQITYNPKHPILQPLSTLQAQINTTWTHATPKTKGSESRLVSFETVCTLIGLAHLGIDERAFLKLQFQPHDERVNLSEVKLVTSSGRSGSSKGFVGIRTGPQPGASSKTSTSALSRIPSLRAPASTAASSSKATENNNFDMGLLDTTMLDDNGDLMQVAPPKGLFNHDMSFSVDHQAFVDESAISDISTLERVKQMAGGGGNGQPGELKKPVKGNDDLPAGLLTDQNSFAVVIDVDEALGVTPSRLKDNITLRFEGKISVPHLSAIPLQNLNFAIPTATQAQTRSTVAQQLQRQVDEEDAAERVVRDEEREAKLKSEREQEKSASKIEQSGSGFTIGQRASTRSMSSESIQTPVKHSAPPSYFPPSAVDPLSTPTRKKSVRSNTVGSSSEVGDTTAIQPQEGLMRPPERPSIHQRKSSHSTSDPREVTEAEAQEPGLASPLHAPLAPNLARALRKRAASEDRGSPNPAAPRTPGPSSPPNLGVPRASFGGSDESVGSYGSGHKRAEWPTVLSTGTASASAPPSAAILAAAAGPGAGVGDRSVAAADWTMQDLSGSAVGDQSLSHGTLPYTLHEATVEVVPTLRRLSAALEEEMRMVKKVMVPAWPRAELDGRSVPVPSVSLIMSKGDEVVSVWCDHGRLRWMQLTDEEAGAERDLSKGAVLVKVELPASLRNARSSSDQCKLEIRVASGWSRGDAAMLRKGEAVEVQIPVLDCAMGTLDLRFCKPSDAWPTPVGQVEGFRTQRPADVKAYLTSDDVQASSPLKAQIRFPSKDQPLTTVRRQPSLLPRYAIVLSIMALILAFMAYAVPLLKQSTSPVPLPGFPNHLGTLARNTWAETQTGRAGVKGGRATTSSSPASASTTASTTSFPQQQQEQGSDSSPTTASAPSVPDVAAAAKSPTSDPTPIAEMSDASNKDESAIIDDDESYEHDNDLTYLYSLSGSTTLWQRWLESFFGLFRWMRTA
ncbi:hypothetical protein A4X13_0g650 [Tilletia indica]|uniref:Uncharacterized protein n=1 Tax=Tilletia indica TaxID=43049 RepID=A0A177TVC2_9BASI|nr:hypothetical protein A4X13_0g650 [Tilletia indica]